MRTNFKLALITIITCCTVNNNINVFASTSDNNIKMSDYTDSKTLPQHNNFSTIKTSITNSTPNYNKEEITKTIVNQLYNRFVETTEYNNINSISGQLVDGMKEEINKLNDNNLKADNISKLSNALVEFIAKGSLTYGEITPDIALEYYNSISEKKLDQDEINKSRQKDINEIDARETIQSIQSFYNDFIKDTQDGNDATVKYLGNLLNQSNDSKVMNSLIDAFIGMNDDVKLPESLTSDEIKELKKIIKDRKVLPKEQSKIVQSFKNIGSRIRSIFKRDNSNENSNNEMQENNTVSTNSENQQPNEITQDEITNIIIENSNLFE